MAITFHIICCRSSIESGFTRPIVDKEDNLDKQLIDQFCLFMRRFSHRWKHFIAEIWSERQLYRLKQSERKSCRWQLSEDLFFCFPGRCRNSVDGIGTPVERLEKLDNPRFHFWFPCPRTEGIHIISDYPFLHPLFHDFYCFPWKPWPFWRHP